MDVTPWSEAATPCSPLARRNPTVKLAVLTVISTSTLFLDHPAPAAVMWLWLLLGLSWAGRLRPMVLLVAQLGFGGFAAGTLLANLVTRPDDPHALTLSVALALRTMVIGTASVGFLATTDALALVSSLHQTAGLPARLTYSLLAGYRMLEELPREWSLLAAAHSVRDPQPKRPGVGAIGRRCFALLVISIRKGERMAHSLDLRGADRQPRTIWRVIPVQLSDGVFCAAAVTATLLTVSLVPTSWP